MKTLSIDKFAGMNNVFPGYGLNKAFQTSIINMDVRDDNSLQTRHGLDLKIQANKPHSLYEDEEYVLYREGENLVRYLNGNTTVLRTGLYNPLPMSYCRINDKVYYADGVFGGYLDAGNNHIWGIDNPNTPLLAEISGNLPKGVYRVKVSFVIRNGEESGLSTYSELVVNDNSGIRIMVNPPSNPEVVSCNFYISDKDGGRYTFYGNVSITHVDLNRNIFLDYTNLHTGKLLPVTEHTSKIPYGHLLCYFTSRIFTAMFNVIYFSMPYAYSLCRLQYDYVQLPKLVTNLVATSKMLVATTEDEIYVLDSDLKAEVIFKGKIISGSCVIVDASSINEDFFGESVLVATNEGLMLLLPNKQLVNLTGKFFKFDYGWRGQANVVNDRYFISIKD